MGKTLKQMKKTETTGPYHVFGIIIANEWDVDGMATDAVIYADNEDVYLVKDKASVKYLLDAIQQNVKIWGEIVALPNGRKQIDMKSLQVIKSIDNPAKNPE